MKRNTPNLSVFKWIIKLFIFKMKLLNPEGNKQLMQTASWTDLKNILSIL